MSKRLQVLVDDEELTAIKRLARRQGRTVADWVRDALRVARSREAARDPREKLDVLERAVSHSFPTGEIDELLADIERGYLA